MPYRAIPECPEPDYVPEPSVEEELRRYNKQTKAVSVSALMIHLIILVYYFLFR